MSLNCPPSRWTYWPIALLTASSPSIFFIISDISIMRPVSIESFSVCSSWTADASSRPSSETLSVPVIMPWVMLTNKASDSSATLARSRNCGGN